MVKKEPGAVTITVADLNKETILGCPHARPSPGACPHCMGLCSCCKPPETPEQAYQRGVADALDKVAASYKKLLQTCLSPNYWHTGRWTVRFWEEEAKKARDVQGG